ncbi:MAG: ribosome assembly factor SBDS [Promethearchaeota archaeon]
MSQSRGGPKGNFDLGKYIIVKIRKKKTYFEMIADPEEAWKAKQVITELRKQKKEGKELEIDEILHNSDINLSDIFPTFDIFNNVKKAVHSNEEDLLEAFETVDAREVSAHFLLEGEFSWTHEQRQKWIEKKKKQIVTILSRNCINPQTKKPHPPKRIEKAMEEAKVSINIDKTAEEQTEIILKKIQTIIPIRMETISLAIKIPAQYAAKAYNTIDKYAQIKKSEWQTDGSWIGLISLPAGLQMELLEKLNNLTHGKMQSKLINN